MVIRMNTNVGASLKSVNALKIMYEGDVASIYLTFVTTLISKGRIAQIQPFNTKMTIL